MSRPRKHADAAARYKSSRAEMLASGWRPIQVWLSPTELAILTSLGPDRSAAIRQLLAETAHQS